ncbi:BcsE family c-di-GMP-binding protein [Stenotrophomonas sp. Y-13]|uniref:BcsE family c-di-GMP-binding protein n=1 Tax=Stenotrophomonas sp. Y-13 TaxID=3384161 RepID=UPI003916E08F
MISLAIDGLQHELTHLRAGGVYWIACADAGHADLFAAGVLAGADAVPLAVVAALGRSPAPMVAPLAVHQGPARIRLHEAAVADLAPAVRALPAELARCAAARRTLCVLQVPAIALEGLHGPHLARWCRQLHDWAAAGSHCVLLLCHGEVATLAPRLLPLNPVCSGVAQLYPHRGALQYLVHYWSNAEGVFAHRDFEARWQGFRLGVIGAGDGAMAAALAQEGGDRFLYLAQADALEGAPPFSAAWRLFENWSALVAAALQAQAATVVLAIAENADVDALARIVFQLRSERGNGLKLVVREMQPCLRYADERLLLESGASLVAPANLPLARFLTLLETIQGQLWQGRLPQDPERLIRLHRPPDVGGIVTPAQFRQLAGELLEQGGGAVESAVLVLQPVAGLSPVHALQQLQMRRRGDFACMYAGQVWLFLFACRGDGIERALGNLFRLPWRELFDGYERQAGHDVAAMSAAGGGLAAPPPLQAPAVPPAPAPSWTAPRPIRLGGEG